MELHNIFAKWCTCQHFPVGEFKYISASDAKPVGKQLSTSIKREGVDGLATNIYAAVFNSYANKASTQQGHFDPS